MKTQKEEKNNLEDKMEKLKEIFLTWSQSVDINCYTKMMAYRPNYKVQFIWLLILLGSTGATFYFISQREVRIVAELILQVIDIKIGLS